MGSGLRPERHRPQTHAAFGAGRPDLVMLDNAVRDSVLLALPSKTANPRVLLASAASVLALLLPCAPGAMATPILETPWAAPFYHVRGEAVATGTKPAESAGALVFAPPAAGGAVSGVYQGASPYAAGQLALMRLARSPPAESIGGAGDWRGQDNSGDSVFVGTTGTFQLLDSPVTAQSVASASFAYTFSPRADSGENGVPPPGDSPVQTEPVRPDASAAMTLTLASEAPPPVAPPDSQAGRTYAVAVPGASAFRIAASAGADPAPAKVRPNPAEKALIAVFQQVVRQAPHDPDSGDRLASLASRDFRPTLPDVATFTVSAEPSDVAGTQNTVVSIPIRIVNTGPGELSSSLMVFIDQSVAAGNGELFNFFFDRVILR